MGTYFHTTEVVKKDASGNYSVVDLTIDTNYTSVTSGTALTEFTVDGVSLGSVAPTLFTGTGANSATITLNSGLTVRAGVMLFSDGTNDYYMTQPGGGSATPGSNHIDPNRVASVAHGTMTEMIGAFHSYVQFQVVDQSATMYQGDSLLVIGSTPYAEKVLVADDDTLIELDSGGGGTETGIDPEGWSAGIWGGVQLSLDNTFSTNEFLVTVNYTTASGSGSFDAIATTYSTRTYYIPQNGHADLDTITAITSVVDTAVAVTGSLYSDFGLTTTRFVQIGDGTDQTLFGDIGHDELIGKKGDDSLFGDAGNDLIKGGKGADAIYGGAGMDELFGGGGKDTIFGGMDDDDLNGGGANDVLEGGAGDDTLNGNKGNDILRGDRGDDTLKGEHGNDELRGGAGNDTLMGGNGRDTLLGFGGADRLNAGKGVDVMTGGGGADTFILKTDGKTDTITDYKDGTDLIDLTVGFASLTFTDIAPGEVHITHSGETLIVQDNGLGLLTAADFTAADFL